MNVSYGSKLQATKQASVKQLFTNHLGLRIISFIILQIWKKWRKKKKWAMFKCWHQEVNFVREKIYDWGKL